MMIHAIPQPGVNWSAARWQSHARQKRSDIAWCEYCRLLDLREDGRAVTYDELHAALELWIACDHDICQCVYPLEHEDDCKYHARVLITS